MQEKNPRDEQDDQFSEYLAAFDEALATGNGQDAPTSVPVHLRERLKHAQACLLLLAQARSSVSKQRQTTPEQTRPSKSANGLETIGRFRIVRELGRGGCGVVFLAHDPTLQRDVALKVPLPEIIATPEFRRRFLREAQVAAQLNHPNVVAVHESGEIGPIAYIASAYCPGPSLAVWLKVQKTPVPPSAAAALILVLAQAIHHCHAKGVLHRDLKPGNVLLASSETSPNTIHNSLLAAYQPMIADFGLARLEVGGTDKTRTGTVMGTAAYMAPEQAQGHLTELGPHTDVYALGAILFELLAGQPPFKGKNELDTMRLVIHEEPPAFSRSRKSVHRDLETICRKCLEKKPRLRYANAQELAGDLQRFLNGESILARPVNGPERAWRWCQSHPTTASLVALSCLVLLVVLPTWLWYEKSLEASAHRHKRAEGVAQQEYKARQAAEENANTQRYFGLLNQLRQRGSQRPLGWVWAGLQDLSELANIKVEARNRVDLRSEAATLLAGVDLREKTVLTDSFDAYCLAFSPDARYLAAGQNLATAFLWAPIRLYDLASGQVRFELVYPTQLVQLPTGLAPDGAICLAFSADSKYLAVGTRSGQVHCWDLTRKQLQPVSWEAARGRIHELCFHPHKPVIYSLSHRDRFVKRWDAVTGKELARLETARGSIHGLSLHRDGQVLACIRDNKIAYCDADSFRDLDKTGADNPHLGIFRLCYSPDGRFLAVQGEEGILILLDPHGMEVRRFTAPGIESAHRNGINRLEFSPDGGLLFSSSENEKDRTLKVWEVASGRLLACMLLGESGPLAFAVHPQGKIVAAASNQRVVLCELAGGEVEVFRAQHPWKLQNAAFSPTGNLLVCSGEARLSSRVPYHFFSLWDAEQFLRTHHRPNDANKSTWQPLSVAFHPNEPTLAASGWSHNVWLFDSREKEPTPLTCKEPGLLAFDRDGKKLWAILDEQTVQSWHWPTGKVASTWRNKSLQFHGRDQLYCLAAGQRWILAGGRDGQTHVLRTQDGIAQASWPGSRSPIRSLAVSAAETWAAVGSQDGLVRIMSLPEGKVLASCLNHHDSVDGLAIDPADQFLVTCSRENRVHVYTLHNGLPRLDVTLALPSGPVRGLSFHPQGKQLAFVAGSETAVRSWNLEKLQQRLSELGLP